MKNGLLRRYFRKGTDLSTDGADNLVAVGGELNNRVRLSQSGVALAAVARAVLEVAAATGRARLWSTARTWNGA